jgi:hypothetical protein
MSNKPAPQPDPFEPMVYQIRVKGHLDSPWTNWFEGLAITQEDDGITLLTGPVVDQAALHGLLKKVRDLGMPLVSLNCMELQQSNPDTSSKEQKMTNSLTSIPASDMKGRLSTLWTFLMFNMVFADILSFMYPGFMSQILAGNAEGTPITPMFLLIAGVVTEISIAMVFLSRFLKHGLNRWVNIIGGVITILWVIGGGSLAPHYIFFASVEVLCSLVIIGMAWNWRSPAA